MNSIFKNTPTKTEGSTTVPDFVFSSMGQRPVKIAKHSNFLDPLDETSLGNSRRWADASSEVKLRVVEEIRKEARKLSFNTEEISFALAVAYIESGFNPDAAAGSTSASGVGQMIDGTAKACGVMSEDRFALKENVLGFLTYAKRKLDFVDKRYPSIESGYSLSASSSKASGNKGRYIKAYAHYHDGGRLSEGTEIFASQRIPPLMDSFNKWLNATLFYYKGTSTQISSTYLRNCR